MKFGMKFAGKFGGSDPLPGHASALVSPEADRGLPLVELMDRILEAGHMRAFGKGIVDLTRPSVFFKSVQDLDQVLGLPSNVAHEPALGMELEHRLPP